MSKEEFNNEKNLSEKGIIFITGEINDSIANSVCEQIISHNLNDDVNLIQIIINSHDGYCHSGFAIIDIIEWSRIPIYTTGLGFVGSMGLLILMSGFKGKRAVTNKTTLLSHKISFSKKGNYGQLLSSRKLEEMEYQKVINHYLKYSNLETQEEIEKFLLKDVDTWLSPKEAISYGLADYIVVPKSNKNLEEEV